MVLTKAKEEEEARKTIKLENKGTTYITCRVLNVPDPQNFVVASMIYVFDVFSWGI